jgi:hypothetical protein
MGINTSSSPVSRVLVVVARISLVIAGFGDVVGIGVAVITAVVVTVERAVVVAMEVILVVAVTTEVAVVVAILVTCDVAVAVVVIVVLQAAIPEIKADKTSADNADFIFIFIFLLLIEVLSKKRKHLKEVQGK